jgi:SAM-dependent methyltransferase
MKANLVEARVMLPPIVDICCGARGMWFDKTDGRALFLDVRNETHENYYPSGYKKTVISPDVVANFTNIPYADKTFYLVVFDPPHIQRPEDNKGEIGLRYGKLYGEWREMIKKGFEESFRVLKPNGVLIFKWNEVEIPIKEILELTKEKPLFGHRTKKNLKTHWVTFMRGTT